MHLQIVVLTTGPNDDLIFFFYSQSNKREFVLNIRNAINPERVYYEYITNVIKIHIIRFFSNFRSKLERMAISSIDTYTFIVVFQLLINKIYTNTCMCLVFTRQST